MAKWWRRLNTVKFRKEGDWDGCAIALNNLASAPQAVSNGMLGIAWQIIVPALQETKDSGDFTPNAPSTVRKKGFNQPWKGITGATGSAIARSASSGGIAVVMSGDQSIVAIVDEYRPLFAKAWASCEAEVRDAVDSLLASAIAGGAGGAKRDAATGRFTSSYGDVYRGGFMWG